MQINTSENRIGHSRKRTKKATFGRLQISIVSIVLMLTLLACSTYAWFSAIAKAGGSEIGSGVMAADLLMSEEDLIAKLEGTGKSIDEYQKYIRQIDDKDYYVITDTDTAVLTFESMVPGEVRKACFKVANAGQLALTFSADFEILKDEAGNSLSLTGLERLAREKETSEEFLGHPFVENDYSEDAQLAEEGLLTNRRYELSRKVLEREQLDHDEESATYNQDLGEHLEDVIKVYLGAQQKDITEENYLGTITSIMQEGAGKYGYLLPYAEVEEYLPDGRTVEISGEGIETYTKENVLECGDYNLLFVMPDDAENLYEYASLTLKAGIRTTQVEYEKDGLDIMIYDADASLGFEPPEERCGYVFTPLFDGMLDEDWDEDAIYTGDMLIHVADYDETSDTYSLYLYVYGYMNWFNALGEEGLQEIESIIGSPPQNYPYPDEPYIYPYACMSPDGYAAEIPSADLANLGELEAGSWYHAKGSYPWYLGDFGYELQVTKCEHPESHQGDILSCFAAGTMVTMPDSSVKKIEDVKPGEYIRTFDHETGELSSARVIDIATKPVCTNDAFTLHFTDDIDLTIVAAHCLYEKESGKYVKLTGDNFDEYIGREFYNADCGKYETLLSAERVVYPVTAYYVATDRHLNSVANGMLNVPTGMYYVMSNALERDAELKIIDEMRCADLERYGEFTFDDAGYVSEDFYNSLNLKYLNIAVGKGLITKEQIVSAAKMRADDGLGITR